MQILINCKQACDFSGFYKNSGFSEKSIIVDICAEIMQNLGGCHRDTERCKCGIYFLALGIAFSSDLGGVETKFSCPFQLFYCLQDTLYHGPVPVLYQFKFLKFTSFACLL